jgi:hypothetical protein
MTNIIETGVVTSVDSRSVGSPVVVDAVAGDFTLFVNDNVDFSPGDLVLITPLDTETGDYYTVGAVDDEAGITLTTALSDAQPAGSWVAITPPQSETIAMVRLAQSGEVQPCVVLHTLTDALRQGIRDETTAETVLTVLAGDTRYVFDIIARQPVRDVSSAILGDGTSLGGALQDAYDRADAAAAAAANAAANATIAQASANGKNKTTYSLSTPAAAANTAGDIWFQKESATQTIIGQWQGLGGTSWQSVALNDQMIANLDAGKLVVGSAFMNALSVKTNFTLGDAATNGVIQSYNFAGSPVGIYIDKNGLVAKGGSVAGADITGSTLTGGLLRTAASGQRMEISQDLSGGVLRFYRGLSGETPGFINPLISGASTPGLVLSTGETSALGEAAVISMTAGAAIGQVQIFGYTSIQGSLFVNGGLEITDLLDMNGHSVTEAFNVLASNIVSGKTLNQTTPGSTSSAANVFMNGSGDLVKSTSSRRYKTDITDAVIDTEAVLQLRPRTFTRPGDDDPEHVYLGLIAEEVHDLGLHPLVQYDDEDRPDGIDWWAVSVAQQAVIQSQQGEIADERAARIALQAQVDALTARLDAAGI